MARQIAPNIGTAANAIHFITFSFCGYSDLCSSVYICNYSFDKWKNHPRRAPTINPPRCPVKSTLLTTNIGIKFIIVIKIKRTMMSDFRF